MGLLKIVPIVLLIFLQTNYAITLKNYELLNQLMNKNYEYEKPSQNKENVIIVVPKAETTNSNSSEPFELWKIAVIIVGIILFIIIVVFAYLCFTKKICASKPEPEPEPEPVLYGLLNTGETCYLNAVIQALSSSNKLIKSLENYSDHSNNLRNFIQVMKNTKSNDSTKAEDKIALLKKVVKNCNWTKESQQDAFDLLSKLISSLEKEVADKIEKNTKEFALPPKFKLRNIYNDQPVNCQKYLGLSLSLFGEYTKKSGVPIGNLIKEYFKTTNIDDNEDQKTWVVFEKTVPEVLLLHIQANKYNFEKGIMEKPEYYIQFTETLDIKLPTTEKKQEYKFELKGCVHHIGSVDGGHYVAYRKENKNWYQMNDEFIQKMDFDKIPKNQYIFVYEQI